MQTTERSNLTKAGIPILGQKAVVDFYGVDRAREMFWGGPEITPLAKLVGFAAERPKLDPLNYSTRRDYQHDQRRTLRDWQEFRATLRDCAREGVTDAQVVEAGQHRLTFNDGAWQYVAGQYYPMEYRGAAVAVLRRALSILRQSREPRHESIETMAQLKRLHIDNGGHFFDADAMRFFNSRIESDILPGQYFITSERFDDSTPRKYTVRSFDDKGDILPETEFTKFQKHFTLADALDSVRDVMKGATR